MKILLIKPCWSYPVDPGDSTYNRSWPPLSLLNCAAILRERGCDVTVLDASAKRLTPEQVAAQVIGYNKVFITSASLDRWQCPNLNLEPFIKTIFSVKENADQVYLMGTHGTVRTKEILDITGVTAVICGEPEETVAEIVSGKPIETISGVAYYKDQIFTVTPSRPDMDLTSIPVPAYHLIDITDYEYEVLGSRFALLEASRGCPYHCIFCVKSMYGNAFRVKSTDQFIREIDYIIDVIHARTAYFIDLEFTINRPLVEAVCQHLIRRRVPLNWCCQTRADSVDEPLLKLMKSAGCRIVHFGVETGSERIRSTLAKGITFESVENGMRAARDVGLQTVCFFLFGLPGETTDDMEQTIRFAKKLNPTYASFHIALPYPSTDFYSQVEHELAGQLFPKAYTGMVPYPILESIARKAFRSYYLRPRYILGRLKDRDFKTFFKQTQFFISYLRNRLWS